MLRCLLMLSLVGAPASVAAQIYKHVDPDGVTHYSSSPPTGQSYQILDLRCPGCRPILQKPGVDYAQVKLDLQSFADEILDACERHKVDEALVRAIIHAESWFQPTAVSTAGAQGLMQLMPATQQRFDVTEPFDSRQNIEGGVRYLRILLDLFEDDIELASAAYNAGENSVLRYGGIPPYQETRTYVSRVRILAKRYARALM